MPLVKSASKSAFRKNLKAELAAGKPKPQSLAIAYSVQRAAKGKPKSGGDMKYTQPMPTPKPKTGGKKRTMPMPMPAPKPKMGRANMMGRTMMKKGF
jgi:hypothetical protein